MIIFRKKINKAFFHALVSKTIILFVFNVLQSLGEGVIVSMRQTEIYKAMHGGCVWVFYTPIRMFVYLLPIIVWLIYSKGQRIETYIILTVRYDRGYDF